MPYKNYDEYSPSHKDDLRWPYTLTLLGVIVAIVVSVLVYVLHNEKESKNDTVPVTNVLRIPTRPEPMGTAYTKDGEEINVYVVVDPDTQKQYLVPDSGGICLREKNP